MSADINQNKVVCHTFPFKTSSSSSRLRLGLKFISFACSPKASSGVRSLLALFNSIAGDWLRNSDSDKVCEEKTCQHEKTSPLPLFQLADLPT